MASTARMRTRHQLTAGQEALAGAILVSVDEESRAMSAALGHVREHVTGAAVVIVMAYREP